MRTPKGTTSLEVTHVYGFMALRPQPGAFISGFAVAEEGRLAVDQPSLEEGGA